MALDEALMYRAGETGEWTFRVYSWSRPTLSLGRNQYARGGYDLEELAGRGIDVVRRPTGGRAILHDREVTYSVTAPVAQAGDLRESYAQINRLLVAALHALGVEATVAGKDVGRVAGDAAHLKPGLLPCFDHAAPGEIMVAGRKLAGSAQWRSDNALLQHGSILLDDDQMQLASLTTDSAPPIPAPATLTGVMGRSPAASEVADALLDAVRTIEDRAATDLQLDDDVLQRARDLYNRYLDPAWTWRR
jgi:lipoate-protein ligase A